VVDEAAGQFRIQLLDLRLDTTEPTIVRISGTP
jgi:hypothetical protein